RPSAHDRCDLRRLVGSHLLARVSRLPRRTLEFALRARPNRCGVRGGDRLPTRQDVARRRRPEEPARGVGAYGGGAHGRAGATRFYQRAVPGWHRRSGGATTPDRAATPPTGGAADGFVGARARD